MLYCHDVGRPGSATQSIILQFVLYTFMFRQGAMRRVHLYERQMTVWSLSERLLKYRGAGLGSRSEGVQNIN